MCARFSLAGPERIADRYPQFKLRGGWPKRAEGSAADESLEVAQTQRPGFVIVPGEGFGVLHELLEGHALLADALFEHRPGRPFGQPAHLLCNGGFVAS